MAEQTMTRDDVEELKLQWKSDPIWDIEDTDGFEAYYDELLAYRLEYEAECERQRHEKIRAKSEELNCSFELAHYLRRLEWRIERMEGR